MFDGAPYRAGGGEGGFRTRTGGLCQGRSTDARISAHQSQRTRPRIADRSWGDYRNSCNPGLHWQELSRGRSEEHTSELQSLMRISYAVFCLKKKKIRTILTTQDTDNNQKNKY